MDASRVTEGIGTKLKMKWDEVLTNIYTQNTSTIMTLKNEGGWCKIRIKSECPCVIRPTFKPPWRRSDHMLFTGWGGGGWQNDEESSITINHGRATFQSEDTKEDRKIHKGAKGSFFVQEGTHGTYLLLDSWTASVLHQIREIWTEMFLYVQTFLFIWCWQLWNVWTWI